jgi:hypothetical protein
VTNTFFGRARSIAKSALQSWGRRPAFRAPALRLVRAMNRRTFRALNANSGVSAVYVRGSYVRGPFFPLASDVDLVLVLRRAAVSSADDMTAQLRFFQRACRANLSVRDWWQHVLLDDEMPLVRDRWASFGAAEWQDGRGQPAFTGLPPSPPREAADAAWAQACAWSASAAQAFVRPGDPVHSFQTGVRKSLFFLSRLNELDAETRETSAEGYVSASAAHAQRFSVSYVAPENTPAQRRAALRTVVRGLEHAARRWPAPPDANTADTYLSDRVAAAVVPAGLSEAGLDTWMNDLEKRPPPARPLTHVIPANALAAWPWPAADFLSREGAEPPAPAVATARALFLFDTLFLPSHLRLALLFPDREARLERAVAALLRAALLYEHGVVALSKRAIRAAVLDRRTAFDAAAPGVSTWVETAAPAGVDSLFAWGEALAGRAQRALLAGAGA